MGAPPAGQLPSIGCAGAAEVTLTPGLVGDTPWGTPGEAGPDVVVTLTPVVLVVDEGSAAGL